MGLLLSDVNCFLSVGAAALAVATGVWPSEGEFLTAASGLAQAGDAALMLGSALVILSAAACDDDAAAGDARSAKR